MTTTIAITWLSHDCHMTSHISTTWMLLLTESVSVAGQMLTLRYSQNWNTRGGWPDFPLANGPTTSLNRFWSDRRRQHKVTLLHGNIREISRNQCKVFVIHTQLQPHSQFYSNFYQLAVCEARGQLAVRLLYVFHICLFVCLFVCLWLFVFPLMVALHSLNLCKAQ